jgi:hypothetical protein
MKLTLDEDDLLPKWRNVSTEEVKFEMFTREAQSAARAVNNFGNVLFQSKDRGTGPILIAVPQ